MYNSHLRRKFLKTSTAAVKTSTTDALLLLLLPPLIVWNLRWGAVRRYRFMTVTRLSG